MTRTCPQCGSQSGDGTRFCTACGKPFDENAGQPGSPVVQQAGPVMAAPQPDPGRRKTLLIIAGIGVVAILACALVFLNTGPGGLSSAFSFPALSPAMTTPAVTPAVPVATPSPEMTPVDPATPVISATVTDTPVPSLTTAKPVVCPSDRRLCGLACADTMTDMDNCGACGISCMPSQTCQRGICMAICSFGEETCSDGCHNLSFDTYNCGTCGNRCPVGLVCNTSICSPPVTTVIPTYIG